MSEVEKMYELAGIEKKITCSCSDTCYDGSPSECEGCPSFKLPPFTAEKQLSLIKWLGIRDELNFYQSKITRDWVFYNYEKEATHYNFEQGLASWVNYLWQDLTKEERKQIAEILRG